MHRSKAVIGMDEMTALQLYSVSVPSSEVATTATAAPSWWRILVAAVFISTLVPSVSTFSRHTSHIIPGPYFGYSNSSIREVIAFWLWRGSTAFHTALARERFLIRWAAQSAWISVAGTPHTFSV